MELLILVIVLMFGAVMLVSIGEKLRLPWPALMVVLATAVGFVPAWREISVDPHLILPLFLPPLLFATAQRTSWAMFRLRWRAVVVLALLLTSLTIAAVAGVVIALVPGVTVAAAVAIAAAVAPPDPVAVEAVAGPVGIPRRLITTLQSEGLFNDAVAIVVFTAAISATQTDRPFGVDVVGEFALGLVLAVIVGFLAALGAGWLSDRVADVAGRNAITLVLPFGVYLAAEEIGASGVVAVVIAAVQIASMRAGEDVEERLSGKAFWDVIELLVTGVAFGLVGIEVFEIISGAGPDLARMLTHAAIVCGVVIVLRGAWMMALLLFRRAHDPWAAPRDWREALVLTWSGMRGLATLALALAIPVVAADGTQVAAREELLVIAATVVVGTLVLPALSLPWLVRLLGIGGTHNTEQEAERQLARRAGRAALAVVQAGQADLPEAAVARLEEFLSQLDALVAGESSQEYAERVRGFRERQQAMHAVRNTALAAARAEVLRARQEPGVDPEAADRVLRMLDLQSRGMRP
ncbi:cation:proton antiporter [Bogoriella caseilytica]|uniref:Sodium/proton antiporter (CPA1 family) n=1 Tax=Bogoriella caseilytica TaxID=56055 RepID=A0A3N2BC78_9MICO|nr:cation:proton antiporter [Bogoriella caseilytica]ROR72828.1 sodium/proton antiporter (CPA1 family) [Bogoriella caseilytica]